MVLGKVARFDESRGFGFVSPEGHGEDVFLHANDLLVPEELIRPGVAVEFDIEEGGRGPKAANVRLPRGDIRQVIAKRAAVPSVSADKDDDDWNTLTPEEFELHVTETLLSVVPPLLGNQILDARKRLMAVADEQGWTAS